MKLLVDIGNTRLKWAFAHDGRVPPSQAAMHGGEPAQVLAQLPVQPVDAVWIAHVTGAQHEAAIDAAILARYGVSPRYARSAPDWQGLQNRYAEPQRLGVDRWLAMLAAWSQSRGSFCVVDAGTALTADCADRDGRHLGGFIAAGLHTHERAVLGATRFATRDADAVYGGGLGHDTETCVRQGAMLACLGAIDRAAAIAGPDAVRLITGGDAPRLLPHLPGDWQHHPDLVLEGLLALADDRSSPDGDR